MLTVTIGSFHVGHSTQLHGVHLFIDECSISITDPFRFIALSFLVPATGSGG